MTKPILKLQSTAFNFYVEKNVFYIVFVADQDPFKRDGVDVDSMISIYSIIDKEYEEFLKNQDTIPDPVDQAFADILYIKECRLRSVLKEEWAMAPIPGGPKYFVKQGLEKDDLVRVYAMCPLSYNIDKLNQNYFDEYYNEQLPDQT